MALIFSVILSLNLNLQTYIPMRATAYNLHGITATGTETRAGICASGIKELLGREVAIYQRLPSGDRGELIGVYTVEDTGCSPYVIDVWTEDVKAFADRTYKDGCEGKIYIEILEEFNFEN